MRAALVLLTLVVSFAIAACGDDDGDSTSADRTDTAATPTTTLTETPAEREEKPSFPATYVFSGDRVRKCIEEKGLEAPREPKPPAGDEVGRGIVHDRLLVGGAAQPALRLFMFGAADLAREQGKLVIERTPDARVLGTTILEPLQPDTAREEQAAIACLEDQAG